MAELELVMFDIDGTLLDHDGAMRTGVCEWLVGSGLATQNECDESLVELWDSVAERHCPAFRAGEFTFQDSDVGAFGSSSHI